MGMLVNRTPADDATVAALKEHCDTAEFILDTISADDLDTEGRAMLRTLLVEGEPADGLTLHGTRWGRSWCAFRTVD